MHVRKVNNLLICETLFNYYSFIQIINSRQFTWPYLHDCISVQNIFYYYDKKFHL